MNHVKRAIILAAGKGSRMLPITKEIPKPLVSVKGIRMIDTVIQGLHYNGIQEIYIVTGYLKERFIPLEKEYPGVKLINNPWYEECNNISSLYVARDYLEDSIILDGDQLILNPEILNSEFERSGYNAVYTQNYTKEWLMKVERGVVVSCSRTGGKNGWQLYSISRWNKEDGKKLRSHLEVEFINKQNQQIYWDDIVMFCYPEEYELGVREMKREDVVEIDSLEELIAIDPMYQNYCNGGATHENQCKE